MKYEGLIHWSIQKFWESRKSLSSWLKTEKPEFYAWLSDRNWSVEDINEAWNSVRSSCTLFSKIHKSRLERRIREAAIRRHFKLERSNDGSWKYRWA